VRVSSAALDLGIDLNLWPWIWLGVAVLFAIIEFTVLAGSFVLLPFAISAFISSLLGFYDVAIEIQWFAFVFGGAAIWVVMYKRVMKLVGESEIAPGVGAERVIGRTGIVTTTIDPDDTDRRGRVTVDGEVWGALTNSGSPLVQGTKVKVTAMAGTRVHVEPLPTSAENSEAQ
jgi:membrane protein implicated in regulation of membrane protease activity